MKHIKCKTKEQMGKVLKKLENDGYRWASGTMPTEFVPFDSYGEDTVIEADDRRRELAYASYGYFTENHVKVFIDSEDFVRDEKNRPSIVIFRRGRNVIAKDIATGNEGIAKCSPDDCFVFKTGASIALARLMAKTPDAITDDVKAEWKKVLGLTPVKKRVYTDADRNFKAGDRVVVRDWDDMAKEYGVSKWGDIPKDSQFTSSMKHLCGRTATVTCVEKGFGYKKVKVDFDDKSGSTACWTFNPWMFNPIDIPAQSKTPEAKFKVGDHVTLKEGLTKGERYGSLTLWSGRMYDLANGKRLEVETATFNKDDEMHHYYCRTAEGDGYYYTEAMLDKWDESKICEGDKVRVKKRCTGMRYDTYFEWVKEHITDPELLLAFEREDHVDTSLDYEVVKIAPHKLFSQKPIAYIKHKGCYRPICYLFDVEALEKV